MENDREITQPSKIQRISTSDGSSSENPQKRATDWAYIPKDFKRKNINKKNKNKKNKPEKEEIVDDNEHFGSNFITEKDKHNEYFEEFYRNQPNFFKSDEEFQVFLTALREPLPITFRMNPAKKNLSESIINSLKNHIVPLFTPPQISTEQIKDENLENLTAEEKEAKEKAKIDREKEILLKNYGFTVLPETSDDLIEKGKQLIAIWKDFSQSYKSKDQATSFFQVSQQMKILKDEFSNFLYQNREKLPKIDFEALRNQENQVNLKLESPRPLSWFFPKNYAWHVSSSKKILKTHPFLAKVRDFINENTERGWISRQEAVSMIPPLLFMPFIQPEDKILDMCAAPGSKSAQLLEMLHWSATEKKRPLTGMLVANDNDVQRCYLLARQLQRLSGFIPRVIVTNHDATQFPNFDYNKTGEFVKLTADQPRPEKNLLKFDKILCDVMCSGDGTFRKSLDLWGRWSPTPSWALHRQQILVTVRGLDLLKDDGLLVYSTCSMNPIEDEAVVLEVLRRVRDTKPFDVEIVDCAPLAAPGTPFFEGLKWQNGVKTWKVMNKSKEWLSGPNEPSMIAKNQKPLKSIFPPDVIDTPEEAEKLTKEIGNCMRVFPHYQDTGGFFITLLRKKANPEKEKKFEAEKAEKKKQLQLQKEIEREKERIALENPAEAAADNLSSKKKEKEIKENIISLTGKTTSEDETYYPASEKTIARIMSSYGIDPIKAPLGGFFFRTDYTGVEINPDEDVTGSKNKVYYMDPPVAEILRVNKNYKQWRIANSGLRAFEILKGQRECFRLANCGIEFFKAKMLESSTVVINNTGDIRKVFQNIQLASTGAKNACSISVLNFTKETQAKFGAIPVMGGKSNDGGFALKLVNEEKNKEVFVFLLAAKTGESWIKLIFENNDPKSMVEEMKILL